MTSETADPKGMYYTEVIHKRAIPARIQTIRHLVHGTIHVQPEERVKDELNSAEHFLAVTDAKILDANGQELFTAAFLSIQKTQIVWLAPDEAPRPTATRPAARRDQETSGERGLR